MPFFETADGKRLYYELAGEGQPLLLIHSALTHSGLWDDQWAAFTAGYKVLRVDLYGYGQSTFTESKKINHVADLKALLESLGIAKVCVVGASMGGEIALNFALEHPALMHSLILEGSGLEGYDYPEAAFAWWGDFIGAIQAGNFSRASSVFMINALENAAYPLAPQVRARLESLMQGYSFRHYSDAELLWWQPPTPAATRLTALQCPTLVIVGEHDTAVTHDIADVLARTIPNAHQQVIAGAAHLPNIEQPAAFNQVVLEFLKALQL